MAEVSNELVKWIKEKVNSPFYFVFVTTYIIWNWPYFYALFIEDKIPEGLTTYAYAQNFVITFPVHVGISWLQFILDFVSLSIFSWGAPIVLTYLALYELPKLHEIVHKKSLWFYFRRRLEFDVQDRDYQKEKKEILKEVEQIVKQQRVAVDNIARENEAIEEASENITDEQKWELEFKKMTGPKGLVILNDLQTASMQTSYLGSAWFERLAYANVIGLADFNKSKGSIDLTKKGKYFIKRFIEEKGLN